ncbi:ArtA-dependent S-layer glycoprotein [Haloferax sp. DFSO60]|uniref:ArtA-dependent S-layer glycoprotein n=1 Tax=Haloferax sp. DFSO60 TaxID=3388652 RepID=UPI003979CF4B
MKGNKQIRAVLLAVLMVMSVFAGSIAFTGTAAAAAAGVSVADDTVETGSNASVSVTVDNSSNAGGDYTVWLDDGDGLFEAGEVNETFEANGGNPQEILEIPDVATGDYNVSAYEGAANAGTTVAEANTSLTVTAAEGPELLSAIHYQNGTSTADGEVEVAFDEDVSLDSANLSVDGSEVADETDATVSNGRVLFEVGSVETGDVEFEYTVTDNSGNEATDTVDVTFAPVYVAGNQNATGSDAAYKGSTVAVVSNSTNEDVEVTATDEDNDYQFSGSTGTNSKVFLFNTANRDLGTYEFAFDGGVSSVDVRDLGLDVTVDELNTTDADDVTGTVTANAGGRNVDVVVLDEDGDEVESANFDLDGQGEGDFNVGQLDAGDYTVEVTDVLSGVTVESDTVTVTAAADSNADFGTSVVSEQVGDIAEITITMTGTSTADVTIGSDDVGYTADVTVEDGNDDGEVVLLFNTYQPNTTAAFDVDDSDDSVSDINVTTEIGDSLLDAGDYDLEVATGGDADNVGTLVLEERSTDAQAIWTAPTGATLEDSDDVYAAIEDGTVTESSEVANGDIVVHQISATGLEGAFDAKNFSTLVSDGEIEVTVEQTNPGPNREPKELALNNLTVIADGENDTYFLAYDLSDQDVADDDEFNATFTVLEDSELAEENESVSAEFAVVEEEISLDSDEITVEAAANQSISGTATVAPGTELTYRVRSSGDTQPRFLKTGSAVVQADGTFSADFDFSEQVENDTFDVTVSVDSGTAADATADGTVGQVAETTTATETTTEEPTETTTEATTTTEEPTEETTEATEEPTEETTEETSTGTPGFGIAVALVALVAAALLAVRRD